jgi:disease resistance protein RPM1
VLSLEYCWIKEGHLEGIGALLHLRYLGLTGTPTKKLPEEVGDLKFLQTLMLDRTGLEQLPESLAKLAELVCLRADKKTKVPDWIGKLTSLVELEMYPGADDEFFAKELGKLTGLRFLRTDIKLQDDEQAADLLDSLSKHEQTLEIRISDVEGSTEVFNFTEVGAGHAALNCSNLRVLLLLGALRFAGLPSSINPQSLPNLRKLSLDLTALEQRDMESLGSFERLEVLTLFASCIPIAYGGVLTCWQGGFPNLVSFVYYLGEGSIVKFVPGAMPRLEHIDLAVSVDHSMEYKLLAKDHGLGSLCSLQQVVARICCWGCWPAEAEQVEAALAEEVGKHPNRPTKKKWRPQIQECFIDNISGYIPDGGVSSSFSALINCSHC